LELALEFTPSAFAFNSEFIGCTKFKFLYKEKNGLSQVYVPTLFGHPPSFTPVKALTVTGLSHVHVQSPPTLKFEDRTSCTCCCSRSQVDDQNAKPPAVSVSALLYELINDDAIAVCNKLSVPAAAPKPLYDDGIR
jgi:hypothetical protein